MYCKSHSLLLFFSLACRSASSTLSRNTSGRTLSVRRVGGEINVFLRSGAHIEGRHIHELGSDTNVTLTDQDTGVVDGLGETLLVHLGLQTSFQQLLSSQLQDEIEFELFIRQKTITAHASEEGSSLENTLGIIGLEGKKSTGSLTQLGQGVLNAPDFALTTEAVFTNELELGVETFLLVRTTRRLERLAVCGEKKER